MAVSGISQASEIFSPTTGWSTLPHGTDLPLYPHPLVLEDGEVFFTGGQLGAAVIDARKIAPLTAAETVVPGLRDQGNRDECFSVLLPPAQDQKVMVLGGGGPVHATNKTDIVNLKTGAPHYVAGPNLAHARLPIEHRDVCHLHVKVTDNSNLAPPGRYLLFLCDEVGIPSVAEWIHLDKKGKVRPPLINEKMKRMHIGHGHDHRPDFPIPGFPTTHHD